MPAAYKAFTLTSYWDPLATRKMKILLKWRTSNLCTNTLFKKIIEFSFFVETYKVEVVFDILYFVLF